MELSPSQVSGASFRTVRKGYDHDEVDAFLGQVAKALEEAQQQAVAMEARARAAVARLQEATTAEQTAATERALDATQPLEQADDGEVHISPDEAETITRTLLLAQRTADTAIAEAEAEAERIRAEAHGEAESTIDSTREMSAKLLEDARIEARQATEAELTSAANEVESLVARREFLVGDVDQLEQFLIEQRDRLRAAARQIEALCERVPAGLGAVSAPALSASDDEPGDDTAELFRPDAADLPFVSASELAESLDAAGVPPPHATPSPEPELAEGADAPELPMRGDNPAHD
jgi:DivIVA domain-containing protein